MTSSISFRKQRRIGIARRHHQHRQNQTAHRGNFLEPAREPGQVRLRTRRGFRHRELAALHRRFRPTKAAAGKHRVGQIRRRPEPCHADIEPLRPHRRDRHQGYPQHQIEALLDPDGGGRQRLAGAFDIVRRYRKAGAVAAEHERKLTSLQRVADRSDDGSAGHVDGLVARLGNRLGRFHHIRDADRPVIRQRRIQRRVHQAAKAAKDRYAAVEGFA